MRTNVRQLALAVQEAAGTAVAVTSANALPIANLVSKPKNSDNGEKRRINDGSIFPEHEMPGIMGEWEITCEQEMMGSGVVGTEPLIGLVLEAAGFRKAQVLGEIPAGGGDAPILGIDYDLSSDEGFYTAAVMKDGIIETIRDCMVSNLSLKADTKKRLMASVTLNGIKDAIADGGLLDGIEWPDVLPPQFENVGLSIGDWAAEDLHFSDFSLDVTRTITIGTDSNAAGNLRTPMATEGSVEGFITPELVKKDTYDIFAAIEAGEVMTLSMTVGSVAGNKIIITAPVKLTGYDDVDRNGVAHVGLKLKFGRELKFRFQ